MSRRHEGLTLALLFLAVTASRAATISGRELSIDEAYLAVEAQALLDGGHLYTEIADRKPPIVPYLYAAVFAVQGDASLLGVHILLIFWVFATATALRAIGRRRADPANGGAAAWLFVLASVSFEPDNLAANFELWLLLPAALAVCLAGRGRWSTDLAAGAFVGLAALCKQQGMVTVVPVLAAILSAPRRAAGLTAFAAGLAAPIGAASALVGARGLLFWTVLGNAGYASASFEYAAFAFLGETVPFLACNGALCWLVVRRWRTPPRDLVPWLWLAASAVGTAAGFRFFGHYHLLLLPAACVLAGPAYGALAPRTRRHVTALVVAAAILGAGAGFFRDVIRPPRPHAAIDAHIAAATRAGDRIVVWGHVPEIYWKTGRRPAIRFIHTGFLTGFSAGHNGDTDALATPSAWSWLFEDLAAHPPAIFVDTRMERYPVARYPALLSWIQDHCGAPARLDAMDVYDCRR